MSEALSILPGYYPGTITTSQDIFTSFVEYCSVKESTMKGYIVCLKAFGKWLQENNVYSPTRGDIREYVRFLDNSELKPGTRTQYLRAVKQMYSWATDEGLCRENIARGVKGNWKQNRKYHKKDAISRYDVQVVAATIDKETEQGKRLYAMFLLSIVCGLRDVELSRANVGDIKTVGGRTYLYVWGKGHDEPDEPVWLIDEVMNVINKYLESRTDNPTGKSPLFVSTSNRSKGKRIAPTTISTILKDMLKSAGYDSDRLTAHSLRHTSGTGIYKATHNLYLTQQHLRHANPETSEIYMHCEEREERDTEQRVYDYYFKQDSETDPQQEAITILQSLPADKLEKALSILRALQ